MTWKLRAVGPAVLAALTAALAVGTLTTPAAGAPPITHTTQTTLAQAVTIRDEVDTRIGRVRGAGLSVTEATSTDVIDSFTLLSQSLLDARVVPARGGVWYAICAKGALCPYPKPRLSRPAGDYLPRRLALELALRTFLETDAPVVGVSLPTPGFVAVVFEREALARTVDMAELAGSLREEPLLDPPAWLRALVGELTRPSTYFFIGLEPGPYGSLSWAGFPCWPTTGR